MKKLLLSLVLFVLCMPVFSACTVDTHFDSVSSDISMNLPEMPYDGSVIKVRQRFQFDRDLASLESMKLYEAWLSSPASKYSQDKEMVEAIDESFSLDFVKSISIYLVNNHGDVAGGDENESMDFWMMIPASQLHGQNAMFSEFNLGDLRSYIDQYQQLEIQTEISLEPYYAMMYWRDVCNMSDNCYVSLPLSMQFKMEE